MRKPSVKTVSETNLGIYVWRLPDGNYLADDDLNVLSIEAVRGDIVAMANIAKVAKNLGYDGEPEFAEGYRKIDEEEYEHQLDRLASGLIPDQQDIGVYQEEMRRPR